MEALAPQSGKTGDVYALRSALLDDFCVTLEGQTLLNGHQFRNAFAHCADFLQADFKSIARRAAGERN